MVSSITIPQQRAWELLHNVFDPEVPVLSIIDLGIVRDVRGNEDHIEIDITPTYTGCPAMDVIAINIRMELLGAGFKTITVRQVLSPAWTTDWMAEDGKKKLKEYGIAPPNSSQQVCSPRPFAASEAVECPHCGSYSTILISEFGSTACKSLYKCEGCLEPFDYFKCH